MIEFERGLDALTRRHLASVLQALPPLGGRPILVTYRAESPRIHAGSFMRERRISLHPDLRGLGDELARIFVHELFHFAWMRLGNTARWSYESVVSSEVRRWVPGELGWSAECRKRRLDRQDVRGRSRRWREYCCESFCDSGAFFYSGVRYHPEFTLPAAATATRRAWFSHSALASGLPV
jgi:hypothetical protein